jgi:glycosyltransferase involved in cell wall biosynthesis
MVTLNELDELKVIIVTHVFATGPAQELDEYLSDKVNTLFFIGHPFYYSKDIRSFYKFSRGGKLVRANYSRQWVLPEFLMYAKDFIFTLFWTISIKEIYDIYIGADPLSAFAGLLLKMIGKTDKVILYTVDYVPIRFSNKILNYLYHRLDDYCVTHCDQVWNLSPRMAKEREKRGITINNKQITVPIGVHFNRINRLPIREINRYNVAYMGHLRKGQGLDLIFEVLPQVIIKLPDFKLIIIGTGPLERELKDLAKQKELDKYVDFMGFIEDHKKVEEILSSCSIGLSVYEPDPQSFTWYADPSKPKQYMACGLPVIITMVPSIAKDIEEGPMGLVINYNSEDLENAIIKLLSDNNFYNICRLHCIEFASRIDWSHIYEDAIKQI